MAIQWGAPGCLCPSVLNLCYRALHSRIGHRGLDRDLSRFLLLSDAILLTSDSDGHEFTGSIKLSNLL